MKLTHAHPFCDFCMRLKALFVFATAWGRRPSIRPPTYPKRHRTTAFFEMP